MFKINQYKIKYSKKTLGFTLIELLVVISIIGLLASVVLVSLGSARQKSRVAKRLTDIKQIQTALELYYGDYNRYPTSSTVNWRSECDTWQGDTGAHIVGDNVIPGLVPNYVRKFPQDPSMSQTNTNCYLYVSDPLGVDFKFMQYNLLDMTLSQINQYPTFKDPARNAQAPALNECGTNNSVLAFSIYTSGYRCW